MNTLSKERKIQILSALIEGNSIRSIERMTDKKDWWDVVEK
jgi:hypothetical protein